MSVRALTALIIFLAASNAGFATDCVYPKAPEAVPNGKTASEAEMLSAMTNFKQYNNDVTSYLACLDQQSAEKLHDAGQVSSMVTQIKLMQLKKHNSAVQELTVHTEKFNEQVRSFKSRK